MKISILSPRFVSDDVIDLAESIRGSGLALQTWIAFDVSGPVRTRLSELAYRWELVARQSRDRTLMKYPVTTRPRSPAADRCVLAYAKSIGISSSLAPAMNHPTMVDAVRDSNATVVVTVAAGIVGEDLLNVPGATFINAHPARLPDLPGRDTAEWAVYLNRPVYGTVHRMARRIDAGDLLVVRPLDLGSPKTVPELHSAAWIAAWKMVADALCGLAEGRYVFSPQDLRNRLCMCYRMHPELLRVVGRRLSDGSFVEMQRRCLDEFARTGVACH